MKKMILLALSGLALVFVAARSGSVPSVLLTLGSYGLAMFFLYAVLRPWWRARQTRNENRAPLRFYGYVSLIWLIWLIAASALFVIISHKDDLPPPLQGHANEVQAAALNPAADRLATGGLDRTIRIWNVPANKLDRELPYSGVQAYATYFESYTSVTISPNDDFLAIGSTDKTIRIWDIRKSKLVTQLVGHTAAINALVFSPDGMWLASASADRTVRLWRVSDWSLVKTLNGAIDEVTCLAFNSDSKYLAFGGNDRTVRVYQVSDWTLYKTFTGLVDPIRAVGFTYDNSWVLAVSKTHALGRWNLTGKEKEAKPVVTYREEAPAIVSAAFGNRADFLATGDEDHIIRVWNTNTSQKVVEIPGHGDAVTALDFNGDNTQLVSAGKDKTIRIWAIPSGKNVKTQDVGVTVISAAFNRDAGTIVFTAEDKSVRTLQVKDDKQTFIPLGTANEIVQLAFSGDGKTLVSASRNGVIQNWAMDSGALQRDFVWQSSVVTSLAVNPKDADNIATGNQDGIVRLWSSPNDFRDLGDLAGSSVSSLAFDANGKVLAAGGIDKPIVFWKTDGARLGDLKGQGGKITNLAFSPDGKMLASASLNQSVVLYPLIDSAPLSNTLPITLPHQVNPVTALMFSGDSQTLFTGRSDGTVDIWNVADSTLINTINGNSEPIKNLGINRDGGVVAAALIGSGSAIQVAPVESLPSLQNRPTYSLRQMLLGTELAQIFWAVLLGFVIAAGIVLVPIYGYSGIAARVLERYPGYDPKLAHQAVFSIQLGINKIEQLVLNGEVKTLRPASDELARFGGPGVLIVEEGHAAVLMASGRITRVVGNGITWLNPFERVHMVVYLPVRVEKVVVPALVTHDKIVLDSFELLTFHRADRGDRSGKSGQYSFDPKVILEKIWSPRGSDWREVVQSITETTVRDVVARYDLEDVVAVTGSARARLIGDLTQRLNGQTKGLLGVEVIGCNINAIKMSEEAEKALETRRLAEVERQTLTTQTTGETETLIAKARAEREKVLTEADTKRLTKLADAEAEFRAIVTLAAAEKQKRIALGEGEKEFLSRQGEGKAIAKREEKFAEAEGLGERVRQLSTALARWIVEDERALKLLESMFRGEESRQLMSFMMETMRPGVSPLVEGKTLEGEPEKDSGTSG